MTPLGDLLFGLAHIAAEHHMKLLHPSVCILVKM